MRLWTISENKKDGTEVYLCRLFVEGPCAMTEMFRRDARPPFSSTQTRKENYDGQDQRREAVQGAR